MGKVLVVENEVATREMIVNVVKEVDPVATVLETGSVEKAKDYLLKNSIDLFILDIHLDDGDGIDLGKVIRETHKYKMATIVYISALPQHRDEAYDILHSYLFIEKPFSPDKLKATLKELIDYDYKKNEDIEISVKTVDGCVFRNTKNLLYLEFVDGYLYLCFDNGERLNQSRDTLPYWLNQLPKRYVRCHKGTAIDGSRINSINYGKRYLTLKGVDKKITIGRSYVKEMRRYF